MRLTASDTAPKHVYVYCAIRDKRNVTIVSASQQPTDKHASPEFPLGSENPELFKDDICNLKVTQQHAVISMSAYV